MLYVIGIVIAFAVMIAFVISGLNEISKGLLVYWNLRAPEPGTKQQAAAAAAIISGLEGFELLLVAPLSVTIIISIGRYLQAILPNEDTRQSGEEQIHRVKPLIVILMLSIVSIEFVKRFIFVNEPVNLNELAYGGTVFFILLIYLVTLFWIKGHQ